MTSNPKVMIDMAKTIDPYDNLPKIHQLSAILRQKIEDGEWPPRSAIPSERQLEVIYNISRTTVRESIHHLVREGYLYREHGKGTFVSPQKFVKGLKELTSFSEDLVKRGMKPGQKILDISRVTPSASIMQKLEIGPEQTVLRIERLRFGNDVPIGLQVSYSVLREDQTISREELESSGSLYEIYREKFNLIPCEADETIEATLANPEEARQLQIEPGSPLLLNERIMFAQDRRPLEYVKILYRGDRYQYYVHLTH